MILYGRSGSSKYWPYMSEKRRSSAQIFISALFRKISLWILVISTTWEGLIPTWKPLSLFERTKNRMPFPCRYSFTVHTIPEHRFSRGIAPLILNLGTRWRWVVNFTPWMLYPQERNPVSAKMKALPQSLSRHCWRREKISCPYQD